MKTQTNDLVVSLNIVKFSQKLIISSLLVFSATSVSAGDYQQNMLFSPSEHILMAEARGRVMIYDGLNNKTVEQAMDQQFNRIDSMMFVRTQYEQTDGELIADEDCDD